MSDHRPFWRECLWIMAVLIGSAMGLFPGLILLWFWYATSADLDEKAEAEIKRKALTAQAERHRKKFREPY